MFNNEIRQIGIGDLQDIIVDYLKERVTGQSEKEVFDYVASRSEILYVDFDGNRVAFKHPSLLEYMYADALYHNHRDSDLLTWRNRQRMGYVNYFYVGKMKDCPDLLDSIFADSSTTDDELFSKVHTIGECLMAAYQTPYSSIKKWLKTVIIEISSWYSEIRKEPEKSQLSALPEIHAILAIASVVNFIFSYDFFRQALKDIEVEFFCGQSEEYSSRFNLFLVETVRAYMLEEDAFKNFISCTKPLSPELDIAIAIIAKHHGIKDRVITEIEKRIRRFNSDHKDYLKQLIEKPMKGRRNLLS